MSESARNASDGWDAVKAALDRILTTDGAEFSVETIAQANQFLDFIRVRCPIPEIGRGYLATIIVSWREPAFDVEIFHDHLETYRYLDDGTTDIRHWSRALGEPYSAALISELPTAA